MLRLSLDLHRPTDAPQPTFGELRKFVELTKRYDDQTELPLEYTENGELLAIAALMTE